MALANILATIKKEAEEKIEVIKAEGKKKQEELRADFREREKEAREQILIAAKEEAKKKAEQEKFKAKNQKKSAVLAEKQQVLAEAYQLAVKALSELPESEQLELLSRLIKKLPRDKEGVLIPSAKSERLVKAANEKSGSRFKVSSEHIKGEGGFIFSSPSLEIDNRYSALVNQVREETELEIAKILFS